MNAARGHRAGDHVAAARLGLVQQLGGRQRRAGGAEARVDQRACQDHRRAERHDQAHRSLARGVHRLQVSQTPPPARGPLGSREGRSGPFLRPPREEIKVARAKPFGVPDVITPLGAMRQAQPSPTALRERPRRARITATSSCGVIAPPPSRAIRRWHGSARPGRPAGRGLATPADAAISSCASVLDAP